MRQECGEHLIKLIEMSETSTTIASATTEQQKNILSIVHVRVSIALCYHGQETLQRILFRIVSILRL